MHRVSATLVRKTIKLKIKNGETPKEWEKNPHKLAQKDTDARWTKKNDETHYGYKNHVKVDDDSKIITDYATTSANIHDSNEFSEFLGEDDKVVYADSAYVGKEIPNHVENCVCEKGYRGKPLTPDFFIVSPKNLRQRVYLFSDVLPLTLFGCKPPCSEVA